MKFARVLTAASACVVIAAAGAGCSGSFGSGTGLPNTLASPSFGTPTTSPTPTSTSSILTYGDSTDFQAVPEISGYAASLAFPKAPAPANPPQTAAKGKGNATPAPAATPVSIAIGATLSIVKPADGPDLNFESGKGRKKRSRQHPARALAYVTLLPTHDVTLESYPRFSVDIPRDVAAQYRDGEFGLALWNSGEKDAKYRLAVAELDVVSTPPPSLATPGGATVPQSKAGRAGVTSPSPSPSASPRFGLPVPAPSTLPGDIGGVPSAAPTLPPQRIVFAGTAAPLKLVANRPAVFAVYALPHPASPAPSGSPKASRSTAPSTAAPSTAAPSSAAPSKAP